MESSHISLCEERSSAHFESLSDLTAYATNARSDMHPVNTALGNKQRTEENMHDLHHDRHSGICIIHRSIQGLPSSPETL